jgi:hypothetical protein
MSTLDGYIADGLVANQRLLAFYLANGATSANINDARLQFLAAQGFANDEMSFYASKGYSGTLNERRFQFFRDGAVMELYPTFETNGAGLQRLTNLGMVGASDDFYLAFKVSSTALSDEAYLANVGTVLGIISKDVSTTNVTFARSDFAAGFLNSGVIPPGDMAPVGGSMIEISASRSAPWVRVWRNGTLILNQTSWGPFGSASGINFDAATAWEFCTTGGGFVTSTAKFGLIYVNLGVAPAAPIMYSGGQEINPGVAGDFGGFLPLPQVYFSTLHQTAADWNAGTNLGTGGAFTKLNAGSFA